VNNIKTEYPDIYDEIFTRNDYRVNADEITDRVVVDVGAHVGMFCLFVSQFNPALIIAIEPNKFCLDKLANTLNIIPFLSTQNVRYTFYQRAVHENTHDKLFLHGDKDSGETSTSYYKSDRPVDANITLSQIAEMYCLYDKDVGSVLKMDCEGSEFNILLNTPKETINTFEHIYIEIHQNGLFPVEYLKNHIISCGFELVSDFYNRAIHPNNVCKFRRI